MGPDYLHDGQGANDALGDSSCPGQLFLPVQEDGLVLSDPRDPQKPLHMKSP